MKQPENDFQPQARTTGLLAESVGAETVVYDTESDNAHCLRPLAAAVFARCNGTNSVAEIRALVSSDLGRTIDADEVERALTELHESGLLTTPVTEQTHAEVGISRRLMFRKTAAVGGAAMAAPLIASVVAPTPASAIIICHTTDQFGNPVPCNSGADCGCPPGTLGQCVQSNSGTCLCKDFPGCGPLQPGFTGWCAYHLPDARGGTCNPPCANGTTPCK